MGTESAGSSSRKATPVTDENDLGDGWWVVTEIIAQRGRRYQVLWAGLDENGKPWAPSWVSKKDCTPEVVRAWEEKKAEKAKKRKAKKYEDDTKKYEDDTPYKAKKSVGKKRVPQRKAVKAKTKVKRRDESPEADLEDNGSEEEENKSEAEPAIHKKGKGRATAISPEVQSDQGGSRKKRRRSSAVVEITPDSRKRRRLSPEYPPHPPPQYHRQKEEESSSESEREAQQQVQKQLRVNGRASTTASRSESHSAEPRKVISKKLSKKQHTSPLAEESPTIAPSQPEELDVFEPPEDDLIGDMEVNYLNFERPSVSPRSSRKVTRPSQDEIIQETLYRDPEEGDPDDNDDLFQPTASTQRAAVDSQSQPHDISLDDIDDDSRSIEPDTTRVVSAADALLREQLSSLSAKYQEKEQDALTKQERIDQLERYIEKLRAAGADVIRATYEKQIKALEEENATLQETVQELTEKNERMSEELLQRESKEEELLERIEKLEQEQTAAESRLKDIGENFEELLQTNEELQEEQYNLEQALEEAKAAQSDLETKLEKLRTRSSSKISDLSEENDILQDQRDILQITLEQTKAAHAELESKFEKFRAKSSEEITSLVEENEALRVEVTSLAGRWKEAQTELARLSFISENSSSLGQKSQNVQASPDEPGDHPNESLRYSVCEYVVQGETCCAKFESDEDLIQHVLKAHYSKLPDFATVVAE
ncbi:hypothetical protein K474DRAFT_1710117 [Panus rudis PR-1116 ss-1]|nr:hypothetical protein K474DRAFT_1710117 [Panus rudis PR-1116 ss-1]